MKKFLSLWFLLVLMMASCTDLDITPEDAASEEEIFTNLNAYKSYLAKAYASYSLTGQDGPSGDSDISIVNDEGFTSYIRAYWKAQELTTDEAVVGWTDAGIRNLHEHSWSSENQFVRVLYYRIALIISITNDFLLQSSDERLDRNGIPMEDRAEIQVFRAEARFLRAMAYWHALDLFRNIALVTEITADPPSQSSPQELFEFIETELSEIEDELAAPMANEYGRIDQGGLWMLQAKLYLNAEAMIGQSRYDDCVSALNKVLLESYTLEENYEELFMKDNHLSNEIIFSLPSDGKQSQSWGCTTFLVQAAIGGSMVDRDSGVMGGWAGLRATRNLIEKFPDLAGDVDGRAIFFTEGQSVDIDDIGVFEQGIAVPKFKNINSAGQVGSDPTHVDTDYPMFRLGDAYLMYAEATLRGASNGNLNTAVTLINDLRERAYGNNDGDVVAAEVDLDFILDERSRELYWEGSRRIDLVRYGQFTDNGIWPWKGNVKEGRLTEPHRDIFPIPASDLLANPNLVQNPGY